MPCYHPRRVSFYRTETGKKQIIWNSRSNLSNPIVLPCGQCIGCRLAYSREWALRCSHEASLYHDNCFITLTYSTDYIRELYNQGVNVYSLQKDHFVNFMKRLRKELGNGIRYFMCGEYGNENKRPHFHAILFNCDFGDKYFYSMSNGHKLFRSRTLEDLWPHGYSSIGSFSWESAAYIARYVTKKITGDLAKDHYEVIDELTGEILDREPEYARMSRMGGIGKGWFEKFADDLYPKDFTTLDGVRFPVPRYYDKLYEKEFPQRMEAIKDQRILNAQQYISDQTDARLLVKEKVQQARLHKLVRSLEL
jgi:hypothetical protein